MQDIDLSGQTYYLSMSHFLKEKGKLVAFFYDFSISKACAELQIINISFKAVVGEVSLQ